MNREKGPRSSRGPVENLIIKVIDMNRNSTPHHAAQPGKITDGLFVVWNGSMLVRAPEDSAESIIHDRAGARRGRQRPKRYSTRPFVFSEICPYGWRF